MADVVQHQWDTTLPSEIKDHLDRLPLLHIINFYTLFNKLHRRQLSSQFISGLTSSLILVHTTLPPALTDPLAESHALTQSFITTFKQVKSMITVLLSTVLTTVTIFVPSQGLSNACSTVLTTLNTGLYAVQSANHFALRRSLFNSMDSLLNGPPFPALPHSALTNFPWELFSLLNNSPPSDVHELHLEIDNYLDRLLYIIVSKVHNLLGFMNDELINLNLNPAVLDCHLETLSVSYVYQAREYADSDSDNCSVCLEDLKDGDYARRLRCLHTFHLTCIDRSLRTNRNCPLCRTPIEANND